MIVRAKRVACCGLMGLLSVVGLAAAGNGLRLVEAARNRDSAAVVALLKQEADIHAVQPDGATALHWATHWNDVATADLLIRAGAPVNAANVYGVTPLWLACVNGSVAMVRTLLKAGARVDAALTSGETPLMAAARTGNAEVIDTLLVGGANINAREEARGQTALMWALAERHLAAIRTLIAHGADIMSGSASGFTPLMFAAREGDIEAARLLLDRGATVNAAAADGSTALLVATVRGHVGLAHFLLGKQADPNAAAAGYTPLHWASGTWETNTTYDYRFTTGEWAAISGIPSREEKLTLLRALLAHGADVNARVTKNPPRYGFTLYTQKYVLGATPFYLASVVGDTEVMRVLATAGGDPRLGTNDATTPLIVAAGRARVEEETRVPEKNALEAVKLTLELGNDINAANDVGETALHAATLAGLDTIVQYLAEKGANLKAKTKAGKTPLATAEGTIVAAQLVTRPSTAALLRKLGGAGQ